MKTFVNFSIPLICIWIWVFAHFMFFFKVVKRFASPKVLYKLRIIVVLKTLQDCDFALKHPVMFVLKTIQDFAL